MNKKTLKIAGWALGLSMAVAGIGAAVGASFYVSDKPIMANATEYANSVSILSSVDLLSSKDGSTGWTYTSAATYCGSATSAGKSGTLDVSYSTQANINNLAWNTITTNKLTVTIVGGHNGGTGGITVNVKNNTTTLGTENNSNDYSKNTTASNNNSSHSFVFEDLNQFNKIQITAGAKYYLRTITVTFQYNTGEAVTNYTLTYAAGTNGTHNGTTQNEFSVRENTSTTVKTPEAVGITPNTGYIFNNWSDGSNNNIAPGSSYAMGTSNHTLTAQWVAGVGLSYDKNDAGASGTTDTTYVLSGGTQTVASCDFTAPSGKAFSHWNTSADDKGTPYDPDDTIENFASALTLYAIWETVPTYTQVASNSDLEIGATYFLGGTASSKSFIALNTISSKNGVCWLDPSSQLTSNLSSTYAALLPTNAFKFTLLDAGKDGNENQLYYLTNLEASNSLFHSLIRKDEKNVDFNSNDNNTTNAFAAGSGNIIAWTIAVDSTSHKATIVPSGGTSGERIICNYNNGSPRFTTYTTEANASMALPFLYKLSGSSFETSALDFATAYLKMGDSKYTGNVNTEDNPAEACASNYLAMTSAYDGLNAFVKNVFLHSANATLDGARDRAQAWATANQHTFNVSTGVFSAAAISSLGFAASFENNNIPLIITVAASVGLLTTGGIFLISRRRREE